MSRASVAALLVLATGLAATAQNRAPAQNRGDTPARSFVSQPAATWQAPSVTTWRAHGTPPSVTSQSPRRTFIPVPPSVTSLGPNGFPPQCAGSGPLIPSAMGCTDSRFTGGPVNLQPDFQVWPIYWPYAYPVYVEPQPAPPEAAQEPDPPAPTIFERRPTVAPARPASAAAESQPASLEQSGSSSAHEQVPTILVFRDGHQTEVLNYAIVGQTLYDLGTFVAHKIPLSDLNLKATIKANQERGVEFSVPASTHVD